VQGAQGGQGLLVELGVLQDLQQEVFGREQFREVSGQEPLVHVEEALLALQQAVDSHVLDGAVQHGGGSLQGVREIGAVGAPGLAEEQFVGADAPVGPDDRLPSNGDRLGRDVLG